MNFYKKAIILLITKDAKTKEILKDILFKISWEASSTVGQMNYHFNKAIGEDYETRIPGLVIKLQDLANKLKELEEAKEFFQDQYFHLFEKEQK